jgi:hypothetical protein
MESKKFILDDLRKKGHLFEFMQHSGNTDDLYKCQNCGIEGLVRRDDSENITILLNRGNKKLIDTCKEPEEIRTVRDSMKLKVKFSDEELQEYGKKASVYFAKNKKLREKKDIFNKKVKSKISENDAEINDYLNKIDKGGEEQDVEVEIRYHFPKPNMKRIIRLDTMEVIFEDAMDDEDFNLFNQQ